MWECPRKIASRSMSTLDTVWEYPRKIASQLLVNAQTNKLLSRPHCFQNCLYFTFFLTQKPPIAGINQSLRIFGSSHLERTSTCLPFPSSFIFVNRFNATTHWHRHVTGNLLEPTLIRQPFTYMVSMFLL